MPRHRFERALYRGMLAALLLATAVAAPAAAHHGPPYPSGPDHEHGEMVQYPMVFPVDGPNSFTDTFYASRCCDPGEIHHAADIMAAKMVPILATNSGTIRYINWSSNPDNPYPGNCCSMVIDHDDGWSTWYIHLNNDSPGTDDGQGWGIADGLVPGVHVSAGQLIGWVGDSGNAEGTSPHLHLELIDPHGVRVNPYQALLDAEAGAAIPCEQTDVVCRIYGADRYATAAAVSQDSFPGGAGIVFIATGSDFPDALAGGAVAARLGAPLLLVGDDHLPSSTTAELARLEPSQIVLLGGTAAISETVEQALAGYGQVIRLAGASRYSTAVEVSKFGFGDGAPVVLVATGRSFADALAGGPAAAALGGPVLLTEPDALPGVVLDEITRLDPAEILILGGTGAVSAEVEAILGAVAPTRRVAGGNRYSTAAAISALAFGPEVPHVYLAVGNNFPDALAGSAAAGLADSPLLIVEPGSLPGVIASELLRLLPQRVTLLGGGGIISTAVQLAVMDLLD
ncbi:MAG: cell wall-binding repeat-containing protein [Acidimicrobiia bacterium]|nr:MAG: cell wall-binding repeat-containing protein [Acidimicrobiia bacterium]